MQRRWQGHGARRTGEGGKTLLDLGQSASFHLPHLEFALIFSELLAVPDGCFRDFMHLAEFLAHQPDTGHNSSD
jgi:hypothetical protein